MLNTFWEYSGIQVSGEVFVCTGQWDHDDIFKWKHFPCHWPFVRGIHLSPVDSPHKGQGRGALMFSLICAWTNSWANRDACDLRCHHAYYDISVIILLLLMSIPLSQPKNYPVEFPNSLQCYLSLCTKEAHFEQEFMRAGGYCITTDKSIPVNSANLIKSDACWSAGIILCVLPFNERRRYIKTRTTFQNTWMYNWKARYSFIQWLFKLH